MASDLTATAPDALAQRVAELESRVADLERRLGHLLSGEPRPYPPGQEPQGRAT